MEKMKNSLVIKRLITIGSTSFIKSFIGCILVAFGNLAVAILCGAMISEITNQATMKLFDMNRLLWIGFLLIVALPCFFIGLQLNLRGGLYASKNFKEHLIGNALRMDESLIKEGNTSHIMSVFTNDGSAIDDFYFQSLNWQIVNPIVQGLLAILFLFSQNVMIAVLCITLGIVSLLFTSRYNKRIGVLDNEAREDNQLSTKSLSQIIANDDVIRLLSIKEDVCKTYNQENMNYANKMVETESLKEKINTWNQVFIALSRSLLLGIGVFLFSSGSLDFGVIFILIPLQSIVSGMFSSMVSARNFLAEISNAGRRSFEIIDTKLEDERKNYPDIKKQEKNPLLMFKDVSFAYANTNPLFHKLNLSITPLSTTAFVGESGSGKSTIFSLLLDFYQINDGCIEINLQNIYEYNLKSLRNQIIYIEQSAPLFSRSIKDNIMIGSSKGLEDVSEREVVVAAKKANIHEFIMSLPNGYETIVNESANMISGGQKQRIALARAFISDAPILVMDEPTSALDNDSEQQIQKTLEELRGQKTILIAAHRLSTIKNADHIVALKNGIIIEEGTHEELLRNKNYYYSLYHSRNN